MGDINRRLVKLEGVVQAEPEDARKQAQDRAHALHMAECGNRDAQLEGLDSIFEITESGDVFSTHDGRPIPDGHQALAETWYWQHLAWGVKGHDEEREAFYTREGEFALSRTTFDIRRVFSLDTQEEGEGG